MTKSELVKVLSIRQKDLPFGDTMIAVNSILDSLSDALAGGGRIEIRGFGSFGLRYRLPRIGRSLKSGKTLLLSGKYVPHFKVGKKLRNRLNESSCL